MGSEKDGPFSALIDALPDTLPVSPKIMGEEVEDAIARLPETARAYARKAYLPPGDSRALFDALANEIESLRASLTRVEEERDEAVKALEPLAAAAPIWPEEYWADDHRTHDTRGCNFTIGEYRRAATLAKRLSRANEEKASG